MQPPPAKRRGRHSPEESSPQQTAPGRPPGAERVRVWDEREARRTLVCRVVVECGAVPDCAETVGGASVFASRGGGVALVALDAGRESAGAGLEVGRALKRLDCTVV